MNVVLSSTPHLHKLHNCTVSLLICTNCITNKISHVLSFTPHLHKFKVKLHDKRILYWLSPLICITNKHWVSLLICTGEYCTLSSIPSLHECALTNAWDPLDCAMYWYFLDSSLLSLQIFTLCKCFAQFRKLPTCNVNILYQLACNSSNHAHKS